MPAESDIYCANQPNKYPEGGSADVVLYFDKDWDHKKRCLAVEYMTQYSIIARDDYKRCVCDSYGDGETDCPTS